MSKKSKETLVIPIQEEKEEKKIEMSAEETEKAEAILKRFEYWQNSSDKKIEKIKYGHGWEVGDLAADFFDHKETDKERLLDYSKYLWNIALPGTEYFNRIRAIALLYGLKQYEDAYKKFDILADWIENDKSLENPNPKNSFLLESLSDFGKLAAIMNLEKGVTKALKILEKVTEQKTLRKTLGGSLLQSWDTIKWQVEISLTSRRHVLTGAKEELKKNKEAYKSFPFHKLLKLGIHPQELGLTDQDYKKYLSSDKNK